MPRLRLLPETESFSKDDSVSAVTEYLMQRDRPIAIDTETTGLNKMRDVPLYWSMATEDRRFFFPWEHLSSFDPLFEKRDQVWYLANAKYDAHMVLNRGCELRGRLWDVIVMDSLDDDTRRHGLKDQVWQAYGIKYGEFKELFLDPTRVAEEVGIDRKSFSAFKKESVGDRLEYMYAERPDLVENYATCDAFFTYMLAEDLSRALHNTAVPEVQTPVITNLLEYFEVIEVPLTRTLFGMERRGIKADQEYAKKLDGPLRDAINASLKKMQALLGSGFDPLKKEELREILFGKTGFGLKPIKITGNKAGVQTSTSTPKASVDDASLKILRERLTKGSRARNFLEAYDEWGALYKVWSTYVNSLSRYVHTDGRVHGTINQAVARTSRLSSSDPNLQNIPVRDDKLGIRGIFCAAKGKILLSRDYPQIEFRVAAALAGEEGLMEAIRKGWDIHSANAARMFAKKHPEVTYNAIELARERKSAKTQLSATDLLSLRCRDAAKIIGLGTMYGEGPRKIAADIGCALNEAQEQIDFFFETCPAIGDLIDEMKAYAHEHGFTHTWLGRLRRLHSINNEHNHGIAAAEDRQAFNTLIQGSSAEMLKLAMLQIDSCVEFKALGAEMVLTVHDELIVECDPSVVDEVGVIMDRIMGDPYRWRGIEITFPLPVTPDGAKGFRWSELK